MESGELEKNDPDIKPYQCDWQKCNKSFTRRSDLQRHCRIHTDERPYACIVQGCRKNFVQRSALTTHIRTHTGEKPYQCEHMSCGRKFSDSSSFARHRRIHKNGQPYKCAYDGCTKSFRRKSCIVRHWHRSHQHGTHSSEQDDRDNLGYEGSRLASQQSSQLVCPTKRNVALQSAMPLEHQVYLSSSLTDSEHEPLEGILFSQTYDCRHSFPSGHSTSSCFVSESSTALSFSSHYAPDRNNPRVATLITNPGHLYPYQFPHQFYQEIVQSLGSYSLMSRSDSQLKELGFDQSTAHVAVFTVGNLDAWAAQPTAQAHYHVQQN